MTDTEDVLLREQRGAVLILQLNRPEARNSLNPKLIAELGRGLADAEADPEIRAVVLTGTGDRAFCAGMDLRAFAEGSNTPTEEEKKHSATFNRFTRGEVSIPVVGAANATAVAGGFEVLMGADVIVASSEAKFGLPEVKRGLFAAGGGIALGTRIPRAVAAEILLTGDYFDAQRAYELGLVNQVVEPGEVLDAGVAMAERIAANGPLGLAATKELMQLAMKNIDAAWERQAELQPKVFGSEDAKEGATAFIEKRDPVWKGR